MWWSKYNFETVWVLNSPWAFLPHMRCSYTCRSPHSSGSLFTTPSSSSALTGLQGTPQPRSCSSSAACLASCSALLVTSSARVSKQAARHTAAYSCTRTDTRVSTIHLKKRPADRVSPQRADLPRCRAVSPELMQCWDTALTAEETHRSARPQLSTSLTALCTSRRVHRLWSSLSRCASLDTRSRALRSRTDRRRTASPFRDAPGTLRTTSRRSCSVQGHSSSSGRHGHLARMSAASSGSVLTVSQLPFLLYREPACCHQAPRWGVLVCGWDCPDLPEEDRLRDVHGSPGT